MEQSQIIGLLQERDAELAVEVQSVLERSIESTLRGQIAETLRSVGEALESGQQRTIRRAIAQLRLSLQSATEQLSRAADEQQDIPRIQRLPAPPNLTSEAAKAFIEACGGRIRVE